MSSKEHTALTTDSNSLAQRSTVLTLAIACGLAVAKRTRLFSWYLYLGIVAMERRLCFGIFFVSCGVYHSFQCT